MKNVLRDKIQDSNEIGHYNEVIHLTPFNTSNIRFLKLYIRHLFVKYFP